MYLSVSWKYVGVVEVALQNGTTFYYVYYHTLCEQFTFRQMSKIVHSCEACIAKFGNCES